MWIRVLGSGTSQGIPVIGCSCATCNSTDWRDKRLRTSILIEIEHTTIIIDAGPDFRQQMLQANVQTLSAILLTHEHNDHIIGLDDVRPFNFKQQKNMPIYALDRVLKDIEHRFEYIFQEKPYPGAPQLELLRIQADQPFSIDGIQIIPIATIHGRLPILGFRIGELTYLTDAKYIEQKEFDKIKGSKILIISALHEKMHHSHLNLSEAVEFIDKAEVEKAFITHLSHRMPPTAIIEKKLPQNIRFAYDGMEILI